MSDHIFSTKKAYVLIGDTNNGKTSTINTMISCLTNQSINLYTKNSINASKCITIIHFIKSNLKYKIKYSDTINEFTDLQSLQTKYNNVICNLTEYLHKYVHIYIPIKYTHLSAYVFIDIIGKTSDNIELYDQQLDKINIDFPNNVKIYITKTLSIDICSGTKYNNILLTHADKINYANNQTDLEIHRSIISISRNKINYISNIDDNINIMYDTNSIIYNKHNIVHYLNNLISQFKQVNILSIEQFLDHMKKYNYTNNNDFFQEIRKFNSYKLLEASKKLFKSFISLDDVKKKIYTFNSDIDLMKNHYICYKKDGSGQRANEYLQSSKIKLFGSKYENISNSSVCNKYFEDHKQKYQKNIQILDNIINDRTINDINIEYTKKRKITEV